MIRLSTISITTIENVSAASASLSAWPNASPPASSGRMVSPYPKVNASTTASRMAGRSCHPSAVAMTSPSTSPMRASGQAMRGRAERQAPDGRLMSHCTTNVTDPTF